MPNDLITVTAMVIIMNVTSLTISSLTFIHSLQDADYMEVVIALSDVIFRLMSLKRPALPDFI